MIKLFASDLDGTLLNADHTTDEYIDAGIKKLQEQGAVLTAATGRNRTMFSFSGLKNIYIICVNGAVIVNDRNEIIYQDLLDQEMIRALYENFPDLPLEFNTADDVYVTAAPLVWQESRELEAKYLKPMNLNDDMKDHRHFNVSLDELLNLDIVKVNCLDPQDERSARLKQFLAGHADQLVNAGSYPWIFEITNRETSKASAIKKLAQILGITEDEVAVYGDGGNDLDMLAAFAHSYAPCNGSLEAQETASEVIGKYEDHAVIDHMLQLLQEE